MVPPQNGLPPRRRFTLRPLYLLIIWGLLAILLVVNGTYEARRSQNNLNRMLLDEGQAFVAGLEKSTQAIFNSLTTVEAFPDTAVFLSSQVNLLEIEESVVDQILEMAYQIDRALGSRPVDSLALQKMAGAEHLSGIEVVGLNEPIVSHRPFPFYQPLLEGKAAHAIRRTEKRGTGQIEQISIAVLRKAARGILVLKADEGEIRFFRRRVILQGLTEEWGGKGETKYIVFQGEDGEIWADTDPQRIGKRDETPFLRQIFEKGSGGPPFQSQKFPGILEVARIISLGKEGRSALRVGLSTEKVEQIMDGERRSILLFSLLLLVFGGMAMTFIYRLETRHLERLREMEEKVHQSEKLSSLANLAAAVAHEIRNPLNAIGMAIQRLQREFIPERADLQEEYRRFTDLLRGEVRRVNDTIEQFLFFARPSRLDLQDGHLQDILEDLLLLSREGAEQQKIALEKDVDPGLPSLKLDRQRMQEALGNLFHNSFQAMPNGGRLRVSAHSRDGWVVMQISDTGEGIPGENLGRIFDYYFTTKEKGTGLGLPLAHKIIQDHRGSIEVQSQVGKGTVFTVKLPIPRGTP